jgi:predicted Zn-dependent peptidase
MGKKLRDEQGLSYGIKSNLWIRNYGGYWNIRSNLERENLSRMIRGIFYEIELVQREGVTEEELEKAKARKLALLPLATRTADDIGSIIYEQLQEHKPLDHFDRRREAIMAVTREDIQRVANTYFDTENYIIAVSGNISPNALDEFRE